MQVVPRLRRSAPWISASQPFRAGLTFGSRPYGPSSDPRFYFRDLTQTLKPDLV
jgi:hypothetical protein